MRYAEHRAQRHSRRRPPVALSKSVSSMAIGDRTKHTSTIYKVIYKCRFVRTRARPRPAAEPRVMRRLRPRAADILLPCGSQREGQEVKSGLRSAALSLPFLLRLELLAEDRSYFTLHESPWDCRICQWTFIPTWTVYL